MKTKKNLKRALSLLIVMLMLASLVPFGTISASAVESISGDGTPGNPYLIGTPEGLKKFREIVNGGQYGAYAKLISDIEINPGIQCGTSGYLGDKEPEENKNYIIKYFEGVFDGQGHTISGLYNYYTQEAGLFYHPTGAVIKNLNIDRSYIKSFLYGGMISVATDTTVINCHSNAYYDSCGEEIEIGGIAGKAYNSKFISCTNAGQITSYHYNNYKQQFGGIVGLAENCTFVDCENTGKIDIDKDNMPQSSVGGIVGSANKCSISGCINYADIVPGGGVIDGSSVGGIVGSLKGESSVIGCINNGIIYEDSGGNTAGGIIGSCPYDSYKESKIRDCLNTGTVYIGDVSLNTFIGNMYYANISIDNCFTRGCFVHYLTADVYSKLKISNSYYEDREVRYTTSYGEYKTELNNTIQFTDEMRESGEIAYNLNKNSSSVKFGQDLGTDYYPSINGKTVYYGTNCAGETLYSNLPVTADHHFISLDGKCYICGAYEDEMSALYGYSATLGGNIGLNFIMEIEEEYRNDDTSMNFSVVYNDSATDEQKELYTQSVPFKDAEVITVDGKNYYKFSCNVAAKEMTCAIKGHLVNGDKQGTEFTSSVADYAYTLLYSENATDSTQKLVKAMLNYGAYSQEYFKFYTDYLANCDLSDEEKQLNEYYASDYEIFKQKYVQTSESAISYFGSSLVLETNTEVKHYFTYDSTKISFEDIVYTCTDSSGNDYADNIEIKKWGENGFYIKLKNIPPHFYSKELDLILYDGDIKQCALTFTPVSYFYSVLNAYPEDDGVHDGLRNVVKAYYQYGLEAYGYKVNS